MHLLLLVFIIIVTAVVDSYVSSRGEAILCKETLSFLVRDLRVGEQFGRWCAIVTGMKQAIEVNEVN